MPMIDVYAPTGVFDDKHAAAQRLAGALVLLTEAIAGGWGLWGHAHTNADLVAAARSRLARDGS